MLYCFLADGFEEIEALATVDILRRAGVKVSTVSVNDTLFVTGSHNITVKADVLSSELKDDMGEITGAIYPGGMPGSETLSSGENTVPNEVAKYCFENNLLLCAICAAPLVLGRLGILNGKNATCYPGFENELKGASATGEKVVVDGNVITSKGPGVSADFAFAIVSKLKGEEVANDIRKAMQFDD